MNWEYVQILKVFARADKELTVLFTQPDRSGDFSIVKVPVGAVRQLEGSVWRMQSHIVEHLARRAKRYPGILHYHDAYRATYVAGPIQGRYYDAMGEVSAPFPTSPDHFTSRSKRAA